MIYVCIPSHDEAETVGLVLWKIRKVFEELGREYLVLVADDGSSDHTAEVLERYAKVLPLTVIRQSRRQGYRRSVEALLRRAVELSDRHKRDAAILIHADYVHQPRHLADAVRRLESGADVVVGEGRLPAGTPRGYQLARRWGAAWLRPVVRMAGVRDPLSGFLAFRLATLRGVFAGGAGVLECDDWAANAELLARAAPQARRVETFPMDERHDLRSRPSRVRPWIMARALFRARGQVRRLRAIGPSPVPERLHPEEGRRRSRPRGRRQ